LIVKEDEFAGELFGINWCNSLFWCFFWKGKRARSSSNYWIRIW